MYAKAIFIRRKGNFSWKAWNHPAGRWSQNFPSRNVRQTYISVYRPCTFPISRTVNSSKSESPIARDIETRYREWRANQLERGCLRRFRLSATTKLCLMRRLLERFSVVARLVGNRRKDLASIPGELSCAISNRQESIHYCFSAWEREREK